MKKGAKMFEGWVLGVCYHTWGAYKKSME